MRPKKYKTFVNNNVMKIPDTTLRRWNAQNNNSPINMIEHEQNSRDENELLLTPQENEEIELLSNKDDDVLLEINTPISSRSSSVESLLLDESLVENLQEDVFMDFENSLDWMDEKLYESSLITVSEALHEILSFFFSNGLTKKCLTNLLQLLNFLLPKPNNLCKTKYQLLKLLESLLPSNPNLIKKHQICENCSFYLGPFCPDKPIRVCKNCNNSKIPNFFIEYDLKSLLKDAFEVRDLKNLINLHNKQNENIDENIICDFTSAMKYKKFKQEKLQDSLDVCLIWNTDGAPVSKSSNAQIWPIQVKVLNIPPKKRRSYQYLVGIYYSNGKKPPMNSFLRPFADCLKDLYENGIEWYDKIENKMQRSIVIAPIATLDCPARATVQNLMQFNGEYGCTLCEHPGFRCFTGLGHTRVYPVLQDDPPLRTKESILTQATITITNGLEHVKGVKGLSIVTLIPCFDCATSFVTDYMHATLLGVARMLFNLWFDGKNNKKLFYIHKAARIEIDNALKKISPPDFIVRFPRPLKNIKYYKASEIRDLLLFYFPLILKDKLHTLFYKHFLLLVYGTRILLQDEISCNEVNIAESLLSEFSRQVETLYGLEKCSFNVHQLTHMAECVRMWGPLWTWSAFTFEDAIGYYKKINHGPNKVDMEIVNTLKMFNAFHILKNVLNTKTLEITEENSTTVIGKPIKYKLNMDEIEALQNVNLIRDLGISRDNYTIITFARARKEQHIISSRIYKRQKKRTNSIVSWNNKSQYGEVQFFLSINGSVFVIIRELTRNLLEKNIIVNDLNLCDILIPMRLTYCYYAVPLTLINETVLFVNNYICTMPNYNEKK